MQITADVSEVSKTVQRDLTFILNFFQNLGNVLSDFVAHFSNAFWHENESFPKGSS